MRENARPVLRSCALSSAEQAVGRPVHDSQQGSLVPGSWLGSPRPGLAWLWLGWVWGGPQATVGHPPGC